jgi:hypothetical protein
VIVTVPEGVTLSVKPYAVPVAGGPENTYVGLVAGASENTLPDVRSRVLVEMLPTVSPEGVALINPVV